MSSEIMLTGGSFQVLLLLILVICISVFFFFEIRKINLKLTSQEMSIQRLKDEYNEYVEANSKNDISMTNITQDLNLSDSKIEEKDLDVRGGVSPTTSREPVYMNQEITLSEIVPLNNDSDDYTKDYVKKHDKETDLIEDVEGDSDNISNNDSDNISNNDSIDSVDSDNSVDSVDSVDSDDSDDSDESQELDIEGIINELQEMSVKELKTILQEKGLTVSGNKSTMIERIISSLK